MPRVRRLWPELQQQSTEQVQLSLHGLLLSQATSLIGVAYLRLSVPDGGLVKAQTLSLSNPIKASTLVCESQAAEERVNWFVEDWPCFGLDEHSPVHADNTARSASKSGATC